MSNVELLAGKYLLLVWLITKSRVWMNLNIESLRINDVKCEAIDIIDCQVPLSSVSARFHTEEQHSIRILSTMTTVVFKHQLGVSLLWAINSTTALS